MTTMRLSPTTRRLALETLGRNRLSEITACLDLDVGDRRVIANHVDAILGSQEVDFADVLGLLQRAELKSMCGALGLDTRGREKQRIIHRILGLSDKPEQPSLFTPSELTATAPVETALRLPFRPRARILQLLGDELIGSPRLAVFELVKNAYDACARQVRVCLGGLGTPDPWIEVRDHGDGMDLPTIENIWLVPGHDHRKRQRESGTRSHCGRLPLGEKGVGRFAAHKLGERITLVTRSAGHPECLVKINWKNMIGEQYLSEAPVEVKTRNPEVFTGRKTGTLIRVHELRPPEWTRGEVRRLHRQITSICSPFDSPHAFAVKLEVPGKEHWLEDLPQVQDIVDRAFWHFEFAFDGKSYDWKYDFRPQGLKLDGRRVQQTDDRLLIPEDSTADDEPPKGSRKAVVADAHHVLGIGPIRGELHVYDRDKKVLRTLSLPQSLENYLDRNGGIRVYRDGIRVYNYGESGEDWLGLDLRRVNIPTRRLSRNIVLGAVHVQLDASQYLVEKTNREGFVENDAFQRLRRLVLGAITTLEAERRPDKERIRALLSKSNMEDRRGLRGPLDALKKELQKQGVYERCERHVHAVEQRYEEMQENLLRPAMSGLNLSVVFHEVERGIKELLAATRNREPPEQIELQARHMAELLKNFSELLRRHEKKHHRIASVIDHLRGISQIRFKLHKVVLENSLSMDSNQGFEASFAFGLMLGAVSNLIDNSIYWLRVRWGEEPRDWGASPRRIYVDESRDLEGGPALIIADTGPGFRDDPADLVRPFFTRKPEGMGLGLYYTNLVMELSGGRLVFPNKGDIDLPARFDGAVIALQFPEER